MIKSSGEHDVRVQAALAQLIDSGKYHPNLKADSRLCRSDEDRPARHHQIDKTVVELDRIAWLPAQESLDRVAAAGMRLILVRERPAAIAASPQIVVCVHG
jgi:hypothetical protein